MFRYSRLLIIEAGTALFEIYCVYSLELNYKVTFSMPHRGLVALDLEQCPFYQVAK
jgi:hypothetical protein